MERKGDKYRGRIKGRNRGGEEWKRQKRREKA
jgi:hypothetical protein